MLTKIFIVVVCLAPILSLAQGTLKITSGAIVKLTAGAVVTLDNMHLDNDGILSHSAGNGTFRFTGNSTTYISGTSLPQFDIIEIAKTGAAQLQLNRNITVVSGVSFISGLINLNNNNILLLPTAMLNNETETSRITGATGGYIEITKTLNAPSSQNPGNLGVIITSSQNLGNTIIRRGHQSQSIGGINTKSVLRYYDIIPVNNSALNATLRFNYFTGELNGLDENNLVLWKSNNNINWTNEGFTTRDIAANYVQKTGITSFSRWTISSIPANLRPAEPLTTTVLKRQLTGKEIFNVYPNPVKQDVTVSVYAENNHPVMLLLYDNKGALVKQQPGNLQPGINQLNMNLSGLSSGIYILLVQWPDGKLKTIRLTKE